MRRKRLGIVALVLALMLALLPAQPTHADTITVDTTSDVLDAAGGTCGAVTVASLPGPDGVTSLREAMCAANNNPGPDAIHFSISGCGGVCTIQPTVALPILTADDTTIDGYTQPGSAQATDGAAATLLIEIDGFSVTGNNGFNIISAGNVIRGLVINRFGYNGVAIGFSTATGNVISGNHIGTDASGTADLGNTGDGVFIGLGAQDNTVGGGTPGERNVISGNNLDGVGIHGGGTTGNTVSGNYIGTDASGTADLGNSLHGVYVYGGANDSAVGPDNVISGNDEDGVRIYGSDTMSNTVSGNHIGVDASGTADLGNDNYGVYIASGAHDNAVGPGNVISGNDDDGVRIADSGTMGNVVSGNFIGTDESGTADVGNSWEGVLIDDGAQDNTVGPGNVISGNDGEGVRISDSGTMGNVVSGNHIGVDASGASDLGNDDGGLFVGWGAQDNTIGPDNVISGNDGDGIFISEDGTTGNVVVGNTIGIAADGTTDRGNTLSGVFIGYGAQNNTVGPDNVISGNDDVGVGIYESDTMGNVVSGNHIGTDASGTSDLGNSEHGVYIYGGAHDNTVGPDNVISGNDEDGVSIAQSGTTGNVVVGNTIGVDEGGTHAVGNTRNGVNIWGGAQDNTVGGDMAGEGNVISGNGYDGINISGSGTTGNVVSSNAIGTDAGGTASLGNAWSGVRISGGAQDNTVGPGNVIAHNDWDGVEVEGSSTTGNTITQNSIFSNTLGIDLTGGANGSIAAPAIVTTTLGSVHVVGTACADCTVELFANSDSDGEGETYVGEATADGSGAFTVTVSSLSDLYLTATATDARGTSEFSEVFTATEMGGGTIYLPIALKNH